VDQAMVVISVLPRSSRGSLKESMKKSALYILFLVLLCNSALLLAQTEPEEIKLNSDQFRDYFYESLKQKAIENYDKSILALEECLKSKRIMPFISN
jgi:hypothetical protein